MTLSDRIAVMDAGRVRQVGTPTEIYEYPASRFVAGFIGAITAVPATVRSLSEGTALLDVPAFGAAVTARAVPGLVPRQEVTLAIRPEKLAISQAPPAAGNRVEGRVAGLAYFGKDSLYRIALPTGQVLSAHAVNARRGPEALRVADRDDRVWISFDPAAAIVLVE
jgi:putrescine transport system ATP-binding protein